MVKVKIWNKCLVSTKLRGLNYSGWHHGDKSQEKFLKRFLIAIFILSIWFGSHSTGSFTIAIIFGWLLWLTLYSRFQKKDPVYFHFECLRVGFYSIFDSLNVGIYVSVVGTTFKTLILETNPFLVRTNGFTADLAFVGNREIRDGGHKYCFTSHSFLLVKFSSPPKKIRQEEIGTNKRRSKRAIS